MEYKSIDELMAIAKSASSHRISEYNINNRSLDKNNKGVIGQIIEEGLFKYNINSNKEADFKNLGVELKVTGLKKASKGYTNKERLVLNIINYIEESNSSFENSSFWHKNKNLLIMFYLYDENSNNYNFLIIDSILHRFSPEDLEIIKSDWNYIHQKIKDGHAELISESDTMYLGACTKGANVESSYRKQPNSNVLARQRAYCLKNSYMNYIVKKYFLDESCKSILSVDEIRGKTFEIALESKLSLFFGQSETELFKKFSISPDIKAKHKYNILLSKMLNIDGSINQTEEFIKANIQLKTIRVEENGTIREHMSFPTFKYCDIVNEEWEDSELYKLFNETKFFFIVFKKSNGSYYFDKIKLWNMPVEILDNQVKNTWEKTKKLITDGNIIEYEKNGKYKTYFPGSTFNHICHVRPHDQTGIKKSGTGYPLPVPDKLTNLTKYTKHCFWLDRDFIKSIIR